MPEGFDDKWMANEARLRAMGPIMESLIKSLLVDAQIRPHFVGHRVKQRSSAAGTFSRKKNLYGSIFELTDLLGLRVITHFEDEVDAVAKVVAREFEVDWQKSTDKRAILGDEKFGYLSLHYIVRVHPSRRELVEYRQYADVWFEIQMRSVLQHAWAEVEHDLGYKSASILPRETRRRFSQLASLLELADNEFTSLRKQLSTHKQTVKEAVTNNNLTVSLDEDSLIAYVATSETLRSVEKRIAKATNQKLRSKLYQLYLASRASELRHIGVNQIDELDSLISADQEILWRFARNWMNDPENQEDDDDEHITPGIGLFYLVLLHITRLSEEMALPLMADLRVANFSYKRLRAARIEAENERVEE